MFDEASNSKIQPAIKREDIEKPVKKDENKSLHLTESKMGRHNQRTRRRFKIWHGIVALVLFVLVLLHLSGSHKLGRRLQILRNKGYPVTIKELEDSYTLPEGARNAADTYLAAFSHYSEWDKAAMRDLRKAWSPKRTAPMDASTRQLVEKFLSDNQKAFSLLHEAASIEYCRYPIDFTNPPELGDPPLKNMVNCGSLLRLDVNIQCENQDSEKAFASIRAQMALAQSMDAPLLIHWLERMGLRTGVYRSIERVLNRLPLSDQQLLILSTWIDAPDIKQDFKRALIEEQCLGLDAYQAPIREVASRTKLGMPTLLPWKMIGRCYGEALGYIDLMQEAIDAADLSDPERVAALKAIYGAVEAGEHGGKLTGKFWPIYPYIFYVDVRHLSLMRATQAALAVERYRLAEGRLPQSLDDLVPAYIEAVPTDPCNGRPLKYRILHPGFVVYGVGDDLGDNGGAEYGSRGRDGQGRRLPCDIPFIVER